MQWVMQKGACADLIDPRHPQPIVGHGSHNARHKGAVPILVLNVPVLPPIHKVRAMDVIYDACSTYTVSRSISQLIRSLEPIETLRCWHPFQALLQSYVHDLLSFASASGLQAYLSRD